MDQPAVIPVDTHVYQIAAKHYLKHLPLSKKTSITEKTYNEISGKMQSVFGSHAGWAHSVLFTADLTMFKDAKT
jgi:N-glycosylase/DNA lyase